MSRVFSDIADQIFVAGSPSINGIASRFTFMCWFKANGAQKVFPVIAVKDPNGAYQTLMAANNSAANAVSGFILTSGTNAESIGPDNSFPDGVWTNAAATYDDSGDRKIRLYINAAEVTYQVQTAGTGTISPDSGGELVLGNDEFSDNIVGDLAECRLYNTVLTQPQIAAAMNSALPGSAVAYWHLCGISNPEPDSSGNGNSGIVTGATAGPDSPVGACSIVPGTPSSYGVIGIGSIFGETLQTAITNLQGLDIIQVVNEGGDVVWNLSSTGTASVNPASPTQGALAVFFGPSFAIAFGPNPQQKDIFQVVQRGGHVVFHVDYQGNAGAPS